MPALKNLMMRNLTNARDVTAV